MGRAYGNTNAYMETSTTPTCPDATGYWGDYNAHMGIYQEDTYSEPYFWQSFSDSTDDYGVAACTEIHTYYVHDVNVSATWLDY